MHANADYFTVQVFPKNDYYFQDCVWTWGCCGTI